MNFLEGNYLVLVTVKMLRKWVVWGMRSRESNFKENGVFVPLQIFFLFGYATIRRLDPLRNSQNEFQGQVPCECS